MSWDIVEAMEAIANNNLCASEVIRLTSEEDRRISIISMFPNLQEINCRLIINSLKEFKTAIASCHNLHSMNILYNIVPTIRLRATAKRLKKELSEYQRVCKNEVPEMIEMLKVRIPFGEIVIHVVGSSEDTTYITIAQGIMAIASDIPDYYQPVMAAGNSLYTLITERDLSVLPNYIPRIFLIDSEISESFVSMCCERTKDIIINSCNYGNVLVEAGNHFKRINAMTTIDILGTILYNNPDLEEIEVYVCNDEEVEIFLELVECYPNVRYLVASTIDLDENITDHGDIVIIQYVNILL